MRRNRTTYRGRFFDYYIEERAHLEHYPDGDELIWYLGDEYQVTIDNESYISDSDGELRMYPLRLPLSRIH